MNKAQELLAELGEASFSAKNVMRDFANHKDFDSYVKTQDGTVENGKKATSIFSKIESDIKKKDKENSVAIGNAFASLRSDIRSHKDDIQSGKTDSKKIKDMILKGTIGV